MRKQSLEVNEIMDLATQIYSSKVVSLTCTKVTTIINKKLTMTKIEALKKTIYNLENDVYKYMWSSPQSCNCGILCSSILEGEFEASETGSIYSRAARCMITGLNMPEVFRVLKEIGFSYQEIHELEFLTNKKIADRAGIVFNQFITLDNVKIHVGEFI